MSDLEFDADGRLWASSYGSGLAVFDGNKFTSFNSNTGFEIDYIKDFLITREREIWMATLNYGVVHIQWKYHPIITTFKNMFNGYKPNQIIELSNGNIACSGVGGLVIFDKGNNFRPRYTPLPMPTVGIYEDRKHGLWLGGRSLYYFLNDSMYDYTHWLPAEAIVQNFNETSQPNMFYISTTHGLVMVENGKRTLLSSKNGLSYDLIKHVFEDRFGNIWVSTWGNGATILNNRAIVHFDSDGKGGDMCSYFVVEDGDGKKWIGKYADGLYTWNDTVLQQANLDLPPSTNANEGVAIANGDIYFVADARFIGRISHGRLVWKWVNEELGIFSMLPIAPEKHIITTYQGAYYLDEHTGKIDTIPGLPHVFMRNAFFDEYKNIWFIGDRGEVYQQSHGRITDFTARANPDHVGINHKLYDPFHHLWWFATDKGVLCWDGGDHRYLLHSGNVLKSDLIFSLTQDSTGRIWAGHVQGVECIDVDKIKITHFGYDQGFLPIETNAGAAYTDKHGDVWLGTLTSFTKFNIAQLEQDSTRGILRLEQIKVNDAIAYTETYHDSVYPSLQLSYNQNNLSFKMVSLCYTNGADVNYSWMLEGLEKDFTTRTNTREINYTNLQPGNYVFKARATNPNGYVTNMLAIKIYIAKPFWNRAGFYLFEIIAFLFIVFLSFRFTRQSSTNRVGQIMTLLTIFIIFESAMLFISGYTDKITNGIPVFQLVMNVLLAATLHPLEQKIQRLMKKWAGKEK
jgi:ligand-binding sensor domain-containing protein